MKWLRRGPKRSDTYAAVRRLADEALEEYARSFTPRPERDALWGTAASIHPDFEYAGHTSDLGCGPHAEGESDGPSTAGAGRLIELSRFGTTTELSIIEMNADFFAILFGVTVAEASQWCEPHLVRGEN